MIKENIKEIVAIEVKIYDWKTAIRQANLNKIACHESYVAIWHEFSHRALRKKELFEEIMSGKMNGYKLRKDDTDHLFLILPPPKNNWEYWETLLHETAHLVQDLAYMKMLGGETEAQAYLHEHLFRSIRRKIMGLK
ncbi:hypothetical protein LCGC14_2758670 [marine sediment metagenome]|uniref:Uncharacterized protein n=1 Tax=marine sediment metagenome TaxID=412755 RepID=A0A0F8ZLL8_9ZZZZ